MGDFLLDAKDVMMVACKQYIEPKIVKLDRPDEQRLFNEFVVSMGGWLDRQLPFIDEFLTDVANGVTHTSKQAEELVEKTDVFKAIPSDIMSNALPSSHNAAILDAKTHMETADNELKLGDTPARRTAMISAVGAMLNLFSKKMQEILYTPIPAAALSAEAVVKIFDYAITMPVKTLADTVDHYTNRVKLLTDLQARLIDADKQLAEKHELHRDHITPDQAADMATIRYVNTSLSFAVKQMFSATQYMHGKATMSHHICKYIASYKSALTSYLKLYTAL